MRVKKAVDSLDKGINEEVISLIKERLEKGAYKYGGGIRVSDNRDWLQEALEEILDFSVYISAQIIIMQKKRSAENLIGKDY